MNYNLLEEKWIPVLYGDGKVDHVNILDAFAQANRIREIAASNPMDRVAVLRFLLALLYWCKGNPPEGVDSTSFFPSDWFVNLEENRDCFNLLGGGKRFYQYGGSHGTKLPVNYLMQEVPTGSNTWHFRHSSDGSDGLCVACCALGLLRLPLFATSGGRGKPPAINQKPPVYVIPLGETLLHTLLLSWRPVRDGLGTPAWEKPDLKPPTHGRVPLLIGLTWVPRRVWLDEPGPFASSCISCGRSDPVIRKCIFEPIGSMKADDRSWVDPHTILQRNGVLQTRDALRSVDAAADGLIDVLGGILGSGESADGRRLFVVQFATVQNDKYLEALGTEFRLPDTLDAETRERAIGAIGRWQKQGLGLALKARPQNEPRKRNHSEIHSAVAAIRPETEAKVVSKATQLIQGGDSEWAQAAREYTRMMKALARSLSPGYTTAALRRQRQIENVKPDMRPKAPAARKRSRKKGGDE